MRYFRYINDTRLKVSLPLAFSLSSYREGPEMITCAHRAFYQYDDPLKFNEEFITLKDNHLLKIYWRFRRDIFKFDYLIDDIVIHRYTDIFTYRDPAFLELVRTVDNRYRYYCWETKGRMSYHRVPIYKP